MLETADSGRSIIVPSHHPPRRREIRHKKMSKRGGTEHAASKTRLSSTDVRAGQALFTDTEPPFLFRGPK